VLLLIRSVRGGAFIENFRKIKEGTVEFVKTPTALRSVLGILWMGIYIFVLLPQLSFIIGSMIFLVVMITALLARTLVNADKKTIAISVAKTVVISAFAVFATYGVFSMFFRVPLP